MNAYSTAYHTIKFTIDTVDEDGFVKSINGEKAAKNLPKPYGWAW